MAVWFSVTSSTFHFSMLCLIMNVEIYSAFFCLFVHDTHCHTHMACLDPLGMLVPVSFSSHQHHMTGHIKKLHVNTHRFVYSWQPVYFTQVQLEKHCYFLQALSKSSYTALITPSTQLSQRLFHTLPDNYVGCERSWRK